jgi:predicted oxidoreductase
MAYACILPKILLAMIFATAANPLVGTWRLNLEKSKFNPGPAPQHLTIRIVAEGGILQAIFDAMDIYGQEYHSESLLRSSFRRSPGADDQSSLSTMSMRAHSCTILIGREMGRMRSFVGQDGNTMTLIMEGKNQAGQRVTNFMFLNKITEDNRKP